MQSDKITYTMGVTGPMGALGFALSRAEETTNRTTYEFTETHTLVARDIVQLYRTYPKRAGESRGCAKCAVKVTTDVSVANASGSGDIVLPLIGEVSFSLPVGVSAAQTLALRCRLAKLLVEVPDTPEGVSPVGMILNDNLYI